MTLPIPGRPPTFESLNLQGQVDHLYKVVDVIARNTQSLAGRSITGRNIVYESISTRALQPGGSYEFASGSEGAPSIAFSSDPTIGFYLATPEPYGMGAVIDGQAVTSWGVDGFAVLYLTPGRVVLAGGSGLLTDDAGLTYDLTGGFTLDVSLQVLIGATDQIKLHSTADSYYNGSGKFGFGTTSPDNKVEITSSTGTQLRLSHTDSNNSYCTFGVDSSGNLYITPWTGGIIMNTAADIADGPVFFEVTCTDDGNAKYEASALGAGDAVLELAVDFGATTWTVGVDNSVSDSFKVASSGSLGSNDRLIITTAGAVSIPSLTSTRVIFAGASGLLTDDAGFTFDGATLTLSDSHATTTPVHIFNQASTGDSAIRWSLATTISYAAGIDNSVAGDPFVISTAASGTAVLGTGNILSITSAGVATFTSIVTTTGITNNGLTSGRVTFAGASGLLTDDADMTFSTATLTVTNIIASTGLTNSALTSGRVVIASTAGLLADDSDLTFSGSTLSATNLTVATSLTLTALTASRLMATDGSKVAASVANLQSWIAGTANQVVTADDGDGTITLSLPQSIATGSSPTFAGLTLSGLTAGRVLFAGASDEITDDAGLTYSAANDALTVAGWLNNGTSVNAVAAGDFDSGLTTSHYMFWDQSAATLKLHSQAAANIFIMNSSNVQVRDIRFNTGDSLRWIIRCDNTAEGGANAGSDFRIIRRSDAGADLGVGLFIDRSSGYVAIGNTGSPGQQLQVEGGSLVCNGTANTGSGVSGGVFGRLDAIPTNEVPTFVAWLNSGTGYAAGSLGLIARSSAAAPIVMFTGTTTPVERLQIKDTGEAVWNDGGNDYDLRIESDDEPYCFQVESTLNNIVMCAGSEPGFQSMDGGVFQAEANVVPTGNPTGGVYKYVEGGAGKGRGTSGTISTYIPAEPHCPKCGYDYIHEWENPGYKQDYLAVCMKCFTDEIGDRPWILRKKAK